MLSLNYYLNFTNKNHSNLNHFSTTHKRIFMYKILPGPGPGAGLPPEGVGKGGVGLLPGYGYPVAAGGWVGGGRYVVDVG